jgi:hypothetical protein
MHTKIWKYEDHPITLYYKALFMQETQPPLQTLQDIRRMMERSSRFISLSGWSGICAGVCALAGASAAYLRLKKHTVQGDGIDSTNLINDLLWIAGIVFIAAFLSAFFFTYQRSKKNNTPIWDPISRRLIWNTVIPMMVGGACILRLLQVGMFDMVAPVSLIFYGLALLNASKYTLGEIRYLAFGQLVLGIINLWLTQYSLLFWALGFGVLHIIYGGLMWWKYER